jgi:IclR family KDG regulon transcriptional repressor
MTGMGKSTTFNLLKTLEDAGYVDFDPGTSKYRLGVKTIQLGGSFLESTEIRQISAPHISHLRDITGESVGVYIRHGQLRVCIDRAWSARPIREIPELGVPFPLWRGTAGVVLLAGMSPEELASYLDGLADDREFDAECRCRLVEKIEEFRGKGIAINTQEGHESLGSAATPVFDYAGRTVAAVVVSGPLARWNDETINEFRKELIDCGLQISSGMGLVVRKSI